MLGLLIPTVSSWFSQGSLANQVSGTSSSNLTGAGAGAGAAQSSITPSNGTQLATAFENLISQINAAANQPGGASTATASTASTASSMGQQAVHGRHHGHGGGPGLSALLQQLDELATGNTTASSGASSAGSTSSATGATAANGVSSTPSVGSASTTQLEATLNQLLQTLKLEGSSTNVATLNSATTAQGAQSLAQRFAQQGIQARTGHLLTAVA
jgi:hypothetical protein